MHMCAQTHSHVIYSIRVAQCRCASVFEIGFKLRLELRAGGAGVGGVVGGSMKYTVGDGIQIISGTYERTEVARTLRRSRVTAEMRTR